MSQTYPTNIYVLFNKTYTPPSPKLTARPPANQWLENVSLNFLLGYPIFQIFSDTLSMVGTHDMSF